MSNYTPGPWAYQIVPSSDDERRGPQSEWSGLYVGPEDDCGGGLMHTIIEGAFSHGPKDGDPEADARLVAAAPEMLEALISVRKIITEGGLTGFDCHEGDWAERLFASQQQTSRAIHKATGKTR